MHLRCTGYVQLIHIAISEVNCVARAWVLAFYMLSLAVYMHKKSGFCGACKKCKVRVRGPGVGHKSGFCGPFAALGLRLPGSSEAITQDGLFTTCQASFRVVLISDVI